MTHARIEDHPGVGDAGGGPLHNASAPNTAVSETPNTRFCYWDKLACMVALKASKSKLGSMISSGISAPDLIVILVSPNISFIYHVFPYDCLCFRLRRSRPCRGRGEP